MTGATYNDEYDLSHQLSIFRDALDKSAIVAITDKTGKIIHVNEMFCEISQYCRQELLGQNHRIVNSGYHGPRFFDDMWKTITSGKVWKGEIKNRSKNGAFYWVYTTIVPLLDHLGLPHQYISIRFEITNRKTAEEQLQIYADFLESSNKELQDFASIAAHDLQEPLRKVQTFADRLKNKENSLSPTGHDYLERMLDSTKRMRNFIDSLLAYSGVAIRGQAFAMINLNEILGEVLNDFEVRIEQVGAQIKSELLPTIQADAIQMRQLFQNLIENALKFHHKGQKPILEIKVSISSSRCTLSFADNGIGFDQIYQNKIFSMFQRLHGRHEYDGSGMGLAICRRIVERHHGTISAQSSPGKGAVISVNLPLTN